ncbi:hypothetical protein Tco_1072325, partial [Tanacetum coccineum]
MSELGLGVTPRAWLKRVLLYMQETRNKSLIPRRNLTRLAAEGARLRPKAGYHIKQDPNPEDVIDDYVMNMSEDMDQLVNIEVEAEIIDVPDDYGLEVVVGLLQATRHTVAVKRIEKVEGDDSGRRLVELKSH